MTKILIDVEDPLHKALKIRAIEEGVSMAEGAIQGIKMFVRKDRVKVEEAEG